METRFWHYDRRGQGKWREDEQLLNSAGMFIADHSKDRVGARRMISKLIFSLLKEGEELVVLESVHRENRAALIRHIEELHKEPLRPLGTKASQPLGLLARMLRRLRARSMDEMLSKVQYDSLAFVCHTPEEMELLISRIKRFMFYCMTKKTQTPFDIILHSRKGYRRVKEGGKDEPIAVADGLWVIVNPRDSAVEVQSERLSLIIDSDTASPKGVAGIRIVRE